MAIDGRNVASHQIRFKAPIHDIQNDVDEKDEERRVPEFRSARSAAEIHVVLEIASNRLAETHGLWQAAEAVRPARRFPEDEDQCYADRRRDDPLRRPRSPSLSA